MLKRPAPKNPLFVIDDDPHIVVKGMNPMQRQRTADGTPYTNTPRTALRPADPQIYLREELAKGSLAENLKREVKPKIDPQDPTSVVKAFLAQKPKDEDKEAFVKKNQEASSRLQSAVSKLSKAVELPDKDEEDEDKSLGSSTPKKSPAMAGRKAGAAVVNTAAAIPKMVLGSVPKR